MNDADDSGRAEEFLETNFTAEEKLRITEEIRAGYVYNGNSLDRFLLHELPGKRRLTEAIWSDWKTMRTSIYCLLHNKMFPSKVTSTMLTKY